MSEILNELAAQIACARADSQIALGQLQILLPAIESLIAAHPNKDLVRTVFEPKAREVIKELEALQEGYDVVNGVNAQLTGAESALKFLQAKLGPSQ